MEYATLKQLSSRVGLSVTTIRMRYVVSRLLQARIQGEGRRAMYVESDVDVAVHNEGKVIPTIECSMKSWNDANMTKLVR